MNQPEITLPEKAAVVNEVPATRGLAAFLRRHAFACLMLLALIVRLIFWSPGIIASDTIGFAMGGLGTFVAHPPGYFAYCFTAWVVNHIFADVHFSLVLISVVSTMIGIGFVYRLSLLMGLCRKLSLLACAAYAFSINILYFSDIALTYATEGMFATAMAYFARLSMARKKAAPAWATTLLWAVGGAFRQTTTPFLAPLWLYAMWKSGQRWMLLLHLCVAALIVQGYSMANNYYLNATMGVRSFENKMGSLPFQVFMRAKYEATALGLAERDVAETESHYHWPFVEVAYWVQEKAGLSVLPDPRQFGAGAPDFRHAWDLAKMQVLKFGFYLVFSLPALAVGMLVWLCRNKKQRTPIDRSELIFLALWIVPSSLFFCFAHFGSLGYLQIHLAAFAILSALLLKAALGQESTTSPRPRWPTNLYATATLGSLLFFVSARPFLSTVPWQKSVDVIALQYSGPSLLNKIAVDRAKSTLPGPAIMLDWSYCGTDALIVEDSKNRLSPQALYWPKVVR